MSLKGDKMLHRVVNEFKLLFDALMRIGEFPELVELTLYVLVLIVVALVITMIEERNTF